MKPISLSTQESFPGKITSSPVKERNEEVGSHEKVLPPIQLQGDQDSNCSLNSLKQLPTISKSKGMFNQTMNPFYLEVKEENKESEETHQQESKNDSGNLSDQVLEMERRREYLKKQRDLIVAKKKMEREETLREYNDKQHRQADYEYDENAIPLIPLTISSSSSGRDQEHRERQLRLQREKERAFLVRKIKNEVVDSVPF